MRNRLATFIISLSAATFFPTPSQASIIWTSDWGSTSGSSGDITTIETHTSNALDSSFFSAQDTAQLTFNINDRTNGFPISGPQVNTEFSRGFITNSTTTFDLSAQTSVEMFSNMGAGARNIVEFGLGISTTNNLADGVVISNAFSNTDAALARSGVNDYAYGYVHGFVDIGQDNVQVNVRSYQYNNVIFALPPGSYYLVGYVEAASKITDPSLLNLVGSCNVDPSVGCLNTEGSISIEMTALPEAPSIFLIGIGFLGIVVRSRMCSVTRKRTNQNCALISDRAGSNVAARRPIAPSGD